MPPISALPAAPDPNDRSTFNARAYPWSVALNGMTSEINAVLPDIDSASAASAAAISAANYKGPWASLAGPLAIPASVFHGSAVYMLTESVANVAVEVPGVSAKWIVVSAAPVLELISATTAAAVATVEWTNFDTLASTYSCLRLVASGLIGSAASADLNGQIKISGTFQATTAWASSTTGGAFSGVSLGTSNQLKNTVSKAMALDLNVYALGITQQPAVVFTSLGGHDSVGGFTYVLEGGSYFDVDVAPTTPIQGLRISASTGTLTGSFRLYGVRKS